MTWIFSLIAVVVLAAVLATPLALFTMLFLGNVGVNWGFLQILPGAMALRIATINITRN